MALGINFDDPRYQKAVLKAGAYTNKNTRGLISDITSRFVGQQMGVKMEFARQAQAKQMHADKLGLAHRRLNIENKMFKRQMRQEKKALDFTTIFGLGTGLYSAVEGQRRREATQKLTDENRAFRQRQEERDVKRQATLDEILRSNR
jgi:hypothetical protein